MNMAKKKTKNKKMLSKYEEDCVWMSYRYCIGRHTIAAHMHAGDIANNAYGRMKRERMMFMSEDINKEIYDCLHVGGFLEIDSYYGVPKRWFRPLEVLYQALNDFELNTAEKIRRIKCINAIFNKALDTYYFEKYENG
jgi:hypothetical protein